MSILNVLSIGRTGLGVASIGLEVVGHNVANSATVGFTKQSLNISSVDPVDLGGLWLGRGASVTELVRNADQLLGQQITSASGEQAEAATTHQYLSTIEVHFDETSSSSMASTLEAFFDSLSSLTTDPSDEVLRAGTLADGESLAYAINATADNLQESMDGVQQDLEGHVDEVNDLLEKVAHYNGLLGATTSNQFGQGDYMDQRDQLINEAAEVFGVTVDLQGDGQATVFIGGHAVVMGPDSRTVTLGVDASGAPKVTISAGGASIDVTQYLGGKIGGVVDAHSDMSGYLSSLDDFVTDLADAFNAQHNAGFDATGAAGGDFFSYSAGTVGDAAKSFSVLAALQSDAKLFAAAGAATSSSGDDDNLKLLIDLQHLDLFDGGTRTAQEEMATIYSAVGSDISDAAKAYEVSTFEMSDLLSLRNSISGVDLDQEASDMIAWQAMYEASARVIRVANEALDELMQLVG
jgi:flagellar hook-associated protein 1 FlgK